MPSLVITSQHVLLPEHLATGTPAALLIEDGKIIQIVPSMTELSPILKADKPILKLDSFYVSAGLIDAHTHLGVYEEASAWAGEDGNEMTDPVTPHVRAVDSINPEDPAFAEAASAGVTAVMITPGSGNVIGGQVAVVKTAGKNQQQTLEAMQVADNIGIKMAFGENPKRVYGKKDRAPMTRMGVAAVLREALIKAQHYQQKKQQAQQKNELFEPDLRSEALLPVLNRTLPARIHAHRHDDILTALRLADEFNLRVVLEHCTEGWKIAETLAKRDIPVNVGPSWTYRSKIELKDLRRDNAYLLYRAGAHVSLITDHPVTLIEDAPTEMQKLGKFFDIPPEDLLAMVTLNPARALGVGNRIGKLAVGYDADVVAWSHHPTDPRAKAMLTIINGQVVFERGLRAFS